MEWKMWLRDNGNDDDDGEEEKEEMQSAPQQNLMDEMPWNILSSIVNVLQVQHRKNH